MAKGLLGFGWMRLPQLSPESEDIDYEQVNQMVDLYLDSGFDYFDTSYVYHNGGSETAIYKCLVSRHPREFSSGIKASDFRNHGRSPSGTDFF